jgi:hypothetical protein
MYRVTRIELGNPTLPFPLHGVSPHAPLEKERIVVAKYLRAYTDWGWGAGWGKTAKPIIPFTPRLLFPSFVFPSVFSATYPTAGEILRPVYCNYWT